MSSRGKVSMSPDPNPLPDYEPLEPGISTGYGAGSDVDVLCRRLGARRGAVV